MAESFDRIALIIIDQLRADYLGYFTNCARVLRYSSICDTNSIPTSTEAMHANIFTGEYPKEHGFISKNTKTGKVGLDIFLRKVLTEEITPIGSIGFNNGYQTICLGGKFEVVQTTALPEECALMVYPKNNKFIHDPRSKDSFLRKKFEEWKNKYDDPDNTPEELDRLDKRLLNLFEKLINNKDNQTKSFYVLTLPSLDLIGHRHGPHSDETISHIRFLDKKISDIIGSNENSLFIIAGDHGCRRTDKYIIDAKEDENFSYSAYRYHRKGELYTPIGFHKFDSDFQHLSYDGGVLRAWFRNNNSLLSNRDSEILARYGTIIDFRKLEQDSSLEPNYIEILKNSKHENLGDIVIVANKDATFCKRSWIDDNIVKEKIPKRQILKFDELPIGEHGTFYDEDRYTLFMSNDTFGNRNITLNLQIREELEKIMGST